MSYIVEIAVSDKEQWNQMVKSIKGYDVFYLNEYVSAFMHEDESNGIPVLLYYENGNDRAVNVVFKRDIAKDDKFAGKIEGDIYFDLITPYGYGGFLGTIMDYDSLNKAYNKYCVDNNYICEFVRFELFSDYCQHYSGEVESRTHNVVRNLESPIDEIWMDFKQKVRKNVKRANKYALEVIVDEDGKYMDDFLCIYYGTMKRSEAKDQFYFSKGFFEEIMSMNDNSVMFHVKFENKIISTELVIYGENNCYSYLGGTDSEYFYTRANDFLKYEIIRWAKEKGLHNFVLGGGYGVDDGIFQYKMNLAPHGVKEFYIGRKIFDATTYQKLVDIRCNGNLVLKEKLDDINFFPVYRAEDIE
nr:GNAT family N-acetyltransferase [uncultured Merdimonas sp.]